MRKQYESDDELSNERIVMERACDIWKCQYHKLPYSYHLDFALTQNDRIKSFAEVKARNMEWGQYPDIMISMSKFLWAKNIDKAMGVDTLLIVWAKKDDEIVWCKLNDVYIPGDSLRYGGRTVQRRDEQDVEPVVHIRNNNFQKLKNILHTK
jgi:hypothetical protein